MVSLSRVKFNIVHQTTSFKNDIKQQAAKNKSVLVGIQGKGAERNDEDGKLSEAANNVDIAVANEFGTDKIPERSFIRASVKKHARDYRKLNAAAAKLILDGQMTVDKYLGQLGARAQADMQNFAVDLKSPPNAPSTIKRKKTENPLVETTQMVNSINYVVVDNKELGDDT